MASISREFGICKDGQKATLYTITNQRGMSITVSDFGALLVKVLVPDANGQLRDVAQGYDTLEEYERNPDFFGAVIGPNANRIAKAAFSVDGQRYTLDANDGENNLHSHRELGYHKKMWKAVCGEDYVTLTLQDPDGSMGFPGNKNISVTYSLNEENELKLHYHATSDRPTVINLTNHSYFNLDGQGSRSILDHEVCMKASRFTEVVAGAIPTGVLAPVAGTPMDFTAPKKVGEQVDARYEQLELTGGYDHNWVIDHWDGSLREFAEVKSADGALTMCVSTTLPGVQFYVGNYLNGEKGKGGACYHKRYALCLETQYYPNSANEPSFPSCIFGGDKEYDSQTVYRFV